MLGKAQTLFKKLEYHFSVESIENATYPHKTALSEVNVKTKNEEYKMDLSQRMEFCQ